MGCNDIGKRGRRNFRTIPEDLKIWPVADLIEIMPPNLWIGVAMSVRGGWGNPSIPFDEKTRGQILRVFVPVRLE